MLTVLQPLHKIYSKFYVFVVKDFKKVKSTEYRIFYWRESPTVQMCTVSVVFILVLASFVN